MKRLLLLSALFLTMTSTVFAANDAVWQKVLDKQTIRCGYVTYEPGFSKNLKTGEFTGYDKDIMEAIAKRLEVKLEWVPASSWGTFVEDMKSNKFDMLCNLTWLNAKNSKYVLYSRPAMYQPAFIVARTDDHRFDKYDLAKLNDPKVSFSALEADVPYYMIKEEYPKATIHALPPNFDFALVVTDVADKKSDLTIADAVNVGFFQDHNPGKIRLVQTDHPARIFGTAFVIPTGENQMKHAIDYSLDEMILSGELKAIFAKYNKYPHSFYYPQISYQEK